jgi:ATP-binding protein involved in chromosome partitioning
MIDPRPTVVARRLEGVRRILAVTGGKGGVGKSVVAGLAALALARTGRRCGLLDLDFTGPCCDVILGVDVRLPAEGFGIEPLLHHGVRFLSISCFGGARPIPLRGPDRTQALLELLAITRWGALDALIVDLPAGLGDTALDTVRLLPRAEYVAVATGSSVVQVTVRRTLGLLGAVGADVAGVVENMSRGDSPACPELAAEFGVPYLGAVPWDDALDGALGDVDRLARTRAAAAVSSIVEPLLSRCVEAAPR